MGILHARIPEWFAIPFSRGSSWSSNQTRVSCIVGGFLTSWATREEPGLIILVYYWIVSAVKASAWSAGDPGSIPGSGRFPWRRKWQPTPVLLPGESHGWRSLVGYSPLWDTIKQTNIRIMGVPRGRREKGAERIFEETMVKNPQIWWKTRIQTSKKFK